MLTPSDCEEPSILSIIAFNQESKILEDISRNSTLRNSCEKALFLNISIHESDKENLYSRRSLVILQNAKIDCIQHRSNYKKESTSNTSCFEGARHCQIF